MRKGKHNELDHVINHDVLTSLTRTAFTSHPLGSTVYKLDGGLAEYIRDVLCRSSEGWTTLGI